MSEFAIAHNVRLMEGDPQHTILSKIVRQTSDGWMQLSPNYMSFVIHLGNRNVSLLTQLRSVKIEWHPDQVYCYMREAPFLMPQSGQLYYRLLQFEVTATL